MASSFLPFWCIFTNFTIREKNMPYYRGKKKKRRKIAGLLFLFLSEWPSSVRREV